mmetsp:Transcript_85/g.296  ORF Transcript_85/g.296 Transcript_85/m.296 type:complete len:208 (+) Transcript_85:447-1070(+)
MPLQPLHYLHLDRLQRGARTLHLQRDVRLEAPHARQLRQLDAPASDLQERPDAVQHLLDASLIQFRRLRDRLNNLGDLRNFFLQPALQAHLHRHGRRRARAAGALQLQLHNRAINLRDGDIATVGHEVRAHLIQDRLYVLAGQLQRALGVRGGRAAGLERRLDVNRLLLCLEALHRKARSRAHRELRPEPVIRRTGSQKYNCDERNL